MASMTISESNIRSLAGRADIQAEFPFLAGYAVRRATGCCGSSSSPQLSTRSALQSIVSMSVDRKAKLKQLLGADIVKVRVVRAGRSREVII